MPSEPDSNKNSISWVVQLVYTLALKLRYLWAELLEFEAQFYFKTDQHVELTIYGKHEYHTVIS